MQSKAKNNKKKCYPRNILKALDALWIRCRSDHAPSNEKADACMQEIIDMQYVEAERKGKRKENTAECGGPRQDQW